MKCPKGVLKMKRRHLYFSFIFPVADPPRFSCGVTGDEIKVSGVIVYDECAVNANSMMNLVKKKKKKIIW
jgi:hypothetical protein